MPPKNERVELETQILKYRQIAKLMASNRDEYERILELVAELEKRLCEITRR